ncbi:hypothetical protein GE061_012504 [Apolygus lucorum]|uniref:MARVEL domain-containing protein n=1 Tax=Apolygus lucorum TaxID=248454 RepID=A0A6A4JTZ4_APOLU|nr:hypothetical protein GE061_012504 [Apolygus lucorum]
MWPMGLLPKLNTCCLCAPLRIGTIIIGIIFVIGSALSLLIALASLLSILGVYKTDIIETPKSSGDKWRQVVEHSLHAIFWLVVFLSSIWMLLGALTGSIKKLNIWLMVNIICFVIYFIIAIMDISAAFYIKEEELTKRIYNVLRLVFIYTVQILIYAYCILVVNSYYQENS